MKKVLALVLCLMLVLCSTAFAYELPEPGTYPIVTDGTTITVMAPLDGGGDKNWETNYQTKFMEDLTGVHVNWVTNPYEVYIEKLNLALAAEDEIDLVVGAGHNLSAISSTNLVKYADQELIQPVEEFMANNAPNMTARLDSVPGFREAITTPDGHIYSAPWYNDCYHCTYYGKMIVNTTWLDNLGLEIPTTTEEFKQMLIAFRDQDANGNGDPNDEIPMAGSPDFYSYKIDTYLMSAFIYDDGENRLMINDEGKVISVFTQPKFKEGLKYIKDLYDEGLIYPDSFAQTQTQLAQLNSTKYENVVGAIPSAHHGNAGGGRDTEAGEPVRWLEYDMIAPLVGPDGLQITRCNYFDAFGLWCAGAGIVPSASEKGDLVFQWLDYLYTDEGIMLNDLGVKGVSWDDADEGKLGVDGSPAVYKRLDMEKDHEYYGNMAWGQTFPEWISREHRAGLQQTDGMMAPDGSGLEAWLYYYTDTNYAPYAIPLKNVVPPLYYSAENSSEVAMLQTNINTYVDESIASFITGKLDIDADWDAYITELSNMKLDRYLEIVQNTYDASAFAK